MGADRVGEVLWRLQSLPSRNTLLRHWSAPYRMRGAACDPAWRAAMQKGKHAHVVLSASQPALGITQSVASTVLHVDLRVQAGSRARDGEARGRPADELHKDVDVLAGEPRALVVDGHQGRLVGQEPLVGEDGALDRLIRAGAPEDGGAGRVGGAQPRDVEGRGARVGDRGQPQAHVDLPGPRRHAHLAPAVKGHRQPVCLGHKGARQAHHAGPPPAEGRGGERGVAQEGAVRLSGLHEGVAHPRNPCTST